MKFVLGDLNREVIVSSLVKHVDLKAAVALKSDFSPMEGDVVAARVAAASGYTLGGGLMSSSLIEDRDGVWRVMYDGAMIITALGNRESTYWNVAELNSGAGRRMQLVSNAGLCSYMLAGQSGRSVNVDVLGVLVGADVRPLNTKSYWVEFNETKRASKKKVSVFVGTSAEVGKTTALLHVLRRLRIQNPSSYILAIKISGTPSEAETNLYKSYGANQVRNLVDLGFPTSYTRDKETLLARIKALLASSELHEADHVLVELGGDVIGGCNPEILDLLWSKTNAAVFLAAFDCFGAEGCSRHLRLRGIEVTAIVGKCVGNPVIKRRTSDLCRLPALAAMSPDDIESLVNFHCSRSMPSLA